MGSEVFVGLEGERWPVAADGVGDGEKGAPVVGDAVVGGRGHGRVAGLQGGEVVLGPAGEFAAEDGFNFGVAAVEMGGDLLRFGFEEQDAIERLRRVSGKGPMPESTAGAKALKARTALPWPSQR